MKFINQPTKHSCGPTSIYNALKWAGSKRGYKKIHKYCDPEPEGTSWMTITMALYKFFDHKKFEVRNGNDLSYKTIVSLLNNNNGIIFSTIVSGTKDKGHSWFMTKNGNEYRAYNLYCDVLYERIARKKLRAFIKKNVIGHINPAHQMCWVIKKDKINES